MQETYWSSDSDFEIGLRSLVILKLCLIVHIEVAKTDTNFLTTC